MPGDLCRVGWRRPQTDVRKTSRVETAAAVDHLVRRAALLGIDLTRLDAAAVELVLGWFEEEPHHPPNRQAVVLGDNSEWCFDPEDIPLLRQVIAGAPATAYVSGRPPEKVTLTYCPAD
jgi:hypothetical protein